MKFKKPKFWDLKKQNLVSYLLFPFTIIYEFYNLILNLKSKKIIKDIKSICVGNIYIGGTGKTPATIKLYKVLKKLNYNVCTGQKYYSKYLDEQILLRDRTNLISENTRIDIIEKAKDKKNELVIFDDGLQDKSLNYDLKIVCFDANKWIGNGQLIPSGPLREKLSSLKKYDVIFLKDQNSNIDNIKEIIKKNNPLIEIFQTTIQLVNINKFDLSQKYLIFSGIGNPESFKNNLKKNNFDIIKEIIFPDHYEYKKNDVEEIRSEAKKYGAKIITTEKDYVKIKKINPEDINFIQIDLKFDDETKLVNFIEKKINEKH